MGRGVTALLLQQRQRSDINMSSNWNWSSVVLTAHTAHEAGLSVAASVNNSTSTSDLIIIMNVLIIVRLNKSITKFVANAFSNRFLSILSIRCCSPNVVT